MRASSRPSATATSRAVLSSLAVARSWPSGLNATAVTPSSWLMRASSRPSATATSRAVSPALAVARSLPSGLNATAVTSSSWGIRARLRPEGCAGGWARARRRSATTGRWSEPTCGPTPKRLVAIPSETRTSSTGAPRRARCGWSRGGCRVGQRSPPPALSCRPAPSSRSAKYGDQGGVLRSASTTRGRSVSRAAMVRASQASS